MGLISKEDLIKAFQLNKMKRNNLLFEYYKDTLFFKGLTAEFIANKISQDLGIEITPSIIYKINHRIIKTMPSPAAVSPTPAHVTDQKQSLKGKKWAGSLQGVKDWEFKNADEYPNKNPLEDAFKGL